MRIASYDIASQYSTAMAKMRIASYDIASQYSTAMAKMRIASGESKWGTEETNKMYNLKRYGYFTLKNLKFNPMKS
jgi:hypothetical protein